MDRYFGALGQLCNGDGGFWAVAEGKYLNGHYGTSEFNFELCKCLPRPLVVRHVSFCGVNAERSSYEHQCSRLTVLGCSVLPLYISKVGMTRLMSSWSADFSCLSPFVRTCAALKARVKNPLFGSFSRSAMRSLIPVSTAVFTASYIA